MITASPKKKAKIAKCSIISVRLNPATVTTTATPEGVPAWPTMVATRPAFRDAGGVRRLFGFGSGFGGACAYAKQGRSCQLSNVNWHMIRGQVILNVTPNLRNFPDESEIFFVLWRVAN